MRAATRPLAAHTLRTYTRGPGPPGLDGRTVDNDVSRTRDGGPLRERPQRPGGQAGSPGTHPPPAAAQGTRRTVADADRLRHVLGRTVRRGRDPGAAGR